MKMGQAFYDFGNIYQSFKKKTENCAIPWLMLVRGPEDKSVVSGIKASEFDEMERRLDAISASVSGEQMTCPDADIVRKEIEFVSNMLRFSLKVGRARLSGEDLGKLKADANSFRDEHRSAWLLRNRPGGLEDSISKLNAV